MIPATLPLLLLSQLSPIAESERIPLVLVLVSASGEIAKIDNSQLISSVERALGKRADYRLELDQSGAFDGCEDRVGCAVDRVWRAREARWSKTDAGRYVLLASRLSSRGAADLISVSLVDARAVGRLAKKIDQTDPDWLNALERETLQNAILVRPEPKLIKSTRALDRYLDERFFKIREALRRAGHWPVFGSLSLELKALRPGALIFLDDIQLGSSREGLTQIERVRAGRRTIKLTHPDYQDYTKVVDIVPGEVRSVAPQLAERLSSYASFRSGLQWVGVASALTGAGFAIWGGVQRMPSTRVVLLPEGSSDAPRRFSIGEDPQRDFILPVGLMLATAGVSWGLGTWLFGEQDDAPWLQLVVGTALGAGLFAVGYTIDPV